MSRYKADKVPKAIERDFPHFVDMAVPPGGLGGKADFTLASAEVPHIANC